jgi:hypothetical protein
MIICLKRMRASANRRIRPYINFDREKGLGAKNFSPFCGKKIAVKGGFSFTMNVSGNEGDIV